MANLYQQTFALKGFSGQTHRFPTDAQLFGQLDLGRQLAARKFVLSDRFTQRQLHLRDQAKWPTEPRE